jgi:penicillin-binding protein 1A
MPKINWLYRTLGWLIVLASAATALVGAGVFLYLSPNLPSVDVLRDVQLQTPLRVYTRDGELIGEFGEMRRTPVKLAELPPLFVKAVLAAEDDSFYHHHGVDVKSLMRAASQLVASGHIQTGGSTITMQVAKNYFLTQERTFSRKFHEILLALQIERELSKDEILELYVNKIFLGNRAYGVEAAAQVYYGKPINELSLGQWAMIAGLPKAPSANNPIARPERAAERRNWILGRMLGLGYINRAQHEAATQEPLGASYHGSVLGLDASYVAEMVRQEMLERFGSKVYTDGYVAYTTLDSKLQRSADRAVVDGLLAYDRRHGYRGPERRLKPATQGDNKTNWQRQLLAIPEMGNLQPAAVLAVDTRAFTVLFANGETATVDWASGLDEMRRFVDEDHRGPAPQTASDIVAVGDVVRVRRNGKGILELQQIPVIEGALISLNADDGAIITLVGGFNFKHSKFNRATQAQRQPGSGFKPFIYTAALEHGFTPATIINDAPIVFQDEAMENAWRPVNDTGKFYGPTPLRDALFKSRNVVSIRVLQQIGIDTAIDYVERFGFDKANIPRNLSIALGSLSVTPMQMVKGFAVFANGGYRIEPYVLQRVLDRNSDLLYEAKPAVACPSCTIEQSAESTENNAANSVAQLATERVPTTEPAATPPSTTAPQVLDKRYAFIMDTMLHDVVTRGTAEAAVSLGRADLAGKTGTTSGPVDTWFTGYSGGIVTTAWAGFDQNKLMGRKEYGATIALPIWMDFMRTALNGRPLRHFKQPEGVVSLRIDPHTGQRASPDQPDAIFEYFTEDNLPGQGGIESNGFESNSFENNAPSNGTPAPPSNGMSVQDLF